MRKSTIPKNTFRNALLVILILAIPIGGFWIVQSYQVYRQDVREDETQYMESQKELISKQVRSAIEFVDYMKSQAESRVRDTIRGRVYEAHAIATNLYEQYRDSKSPEELRLMVREALRPIRYNGGRGYYFAQSMDGINQLLADRPSNEGKSLWDMRDTHGAYVFRDMNEIILKQDEGFYSYTWTKPGMEGKGFLKMSFMKCFEPFDWFFGSGEYLADTEAEIQKEVIDRLARIRWGKDGYLFVFQGDGVCLCHIDPKQVGRNLMDLVDPRGTPITRACFRAGQSGGGFVEYVWNKPSKSQDMPKVAYAQAYEPWGWIIGAGTYLDDIEPVLAERRARLRRQLTVSVLSVMLLVLVTGSLAIVSSSRLSRRLQREFGVFDEFFRNAADTERELNDRELSFSELKSLAASANAMVAKRRQDEEALRESEARHRVLFEDSPDAYLIFVDGVIANCNKATEAMLRCERDQIMGQSPDRFSPETQPDGRKSAEAAAESVTEALRTGRNTFEWVHRRMDGSDFWAEVVLSSMTLNQGPAVFAAIRDISERKQAEKELLDTNRHLEEATARANDLAVRAEASNLAKSEFLANMSHEIRTPMTAILGFSDVILECGNLEEAPPERLEAARTIKRNGEYLLGLINDILDLSKVEAGKLAVERIVCSPCHVLTEVESLIRVRSAAKGLELDIEYEGPIPETIQSDPTRLRQILINLLGNAIKFTETGSVRLITRLAKAAAGEPVLEFDIVDTGLGMTDEQAEKIFQPFSQADTSTTRKFGGSGLGLAISRRLAEALGGDVTLVETAAGVGSRFRLAIATGSLTGVKMLENPREAHIVEPATLVEGKADASLVQDSLVRDPLVRDSLVSLVRDSNLAPAPASLVRESLLAPGAPAPPLHGCRILLAEDGPDNQRLIAHVMKKAGAEVTVVENGKLAMDAALAAKYARRAGDPTHPFDVILMDMQMPVMDGYEATGLLRQKDYLGPIIALTAHAMASDRQKCLDAGCDDYASKPIDRAKLIATIRRYAEDGRTRMKEPTNEVDVLASDLAGDPALADLIEEFVDELPARIQALEQACAGEDLDTLVRLARQLKGSAGRYGFSSITEVAAELEVRAKAREDLDALSDAVQQVADLCRCAAAGTQQSGPAWMETRVKQEGSTR